MVDFEKSLYTGTGEKGDALLDEVAADIEKRKKPKWDQGRDRQRVHRRSSRRHRGVIRKVMAYAIKQPQDNMLMCLTTETRPSRLPRSSA